jgi:NTE family protein
MTARVALALGSGGARGYAHIGVLQVLAERGYEVVTIAGTSMGALVGGVTAAGKLDEYTEWVLSLTRRQILKLLDPTLTGGGALRAERVIDVVATMLGGIRIEDCGIPFTAIATDLTNQREVWFQRGPVHTAIRASIAIPTVITPVVVDGHLLVDGGVLNPVPLEPTAATVSDLTIAVSLSGPRSTSTAGGSADAGRPRAPVPASVEASLRSIAGRVASVRHLASPESIPEEGNADVDSATNAPATSPDPAPDDGPHAGRPGASQSTAMADIVGACLDTMGAVITRYRMAGTPPDVLITVPADACRTMDFYRAAEMIALGRDRAIRALDTAGY